MKYSLSSVFLVSVLALVGGCAATALNPMAARVMVTKTAAPPGCQYLGSVIGEQGGSLTGKYTSNAKLAEGAFNDMKNKAFALGANYVVLEDTHAGNSVSDGSGGQTDVTHAGNAFKCPDTQPGVAGGPAAPAAKDPASGTAPASTGGATNDVVVVRANGTAVNDAAGVARSSAGM